jgi:RNA polymerase sigma-70 factor (ECF subfamily)
MKIFPFPAADNKQGSAARFDELVRPHLTYLYRLAFRFCRNQADAEDLVQDLLLKLYPRCAELDEVDKLRPWLVTSLYRMFVDGTRRQKRSPLELIDDEAAFYETAASGETSPAQDLAEDQRINQIQSAFERLSEDHRVLLTLHDIEGYRLVELEKILEVPVGTLKSRIHRARARMRALLESADLNPDEISKAKLIG